MLRQLAGQHRRQLARRHDMRRLQIVRRGVGDGAVQALFAQPLIDHAPRLAAMYPEVTQREETRQVQRRVVGKERMPGAYGQLQCFAHPMAARETRGNFFEASEHQVQLTLIQRLAGQGRAQVMDFDADARRQTAKLLDQARHANQLDVVGHGNVEPLLAARRLENFAGAQALFDLLQRRPDRPGQRLRPGRWLHGATDAHQQRIVEQYAQAIERITHRRLAQGQTFRRAGNIAFAQQRVQHAQQVEVEGGDIHWVNAKYHKTKFQK